MCPGLTSSGAVIHDDVPEDTPVAIYVEGKEHALAVVGAVQVELGCDP
jgi:PUA domain protein